MLPIFNWIKHSPFGFIEMFPRLLKANIIKGSYGPKVAVQQQSSTICSSGSGLRSLFFCRSRILEQFMNRYVQEGVIRTLKTLSSPIFHVDVILIILKLLKRAPLQ